MTDEEKRRLIESFIGWVTFNKRVVVDNGERDEIEDLVAEFVRDREGQSESGILGWSDAFPADNAHYQVAVLDGRRSEWLSAGTVTSHGEMVPGAVAQ